MNAPLEIKDLTAWHGSVPSAAPTAAGSLAEVQSLLREIRDLQKAHFDRYQEFTSKILALEKTREEDNERLRYEHLRHQEEMRQAAARTQTRQLITTFLWFGIVGLILASGFLSHFLMGFEF